MRFKIQIALSLAIFALLAVNAYAILDGGSGLSADQLIDASNGIYIPYTGIPENPEVARKLWSEESGINFTMPGNLSGNGTNSSMNSGQARAASSPGTVMPPATLPATSPEISRAISPAISLTTSTAASVAGNWSFRLRDSKNRVLALTLFQSENAIFAAGTMNDGDDTQKVSASGSVAADKMGLDVISSGSISLYRLKLNLSGDSASGEYRGFSTNSAPWMGIVEGTRKRD